MICAIWKLQTKRDKLFGIFFYRSSNLTFEEKNFPTAHSEIPVKVSRICYSYMCVYLSLRVWVWSIGFLYKNTRTNCCCISFSLLFFSPDTFRPLPQTARNESVDDGLMCLTCFFILRFSRISKKPTAIATGMVLCWKR